MVYGFANQSEGHLKIYSEVGQGTTIKIYLPRHPGAADEETLPETNPGVSRSEAGETVLVVEDEPVIRDMIIKVLRELGYQALEAANGPAGSRFCNRACASTCWSRTSDCLGVNGRQLADQARVTRPDMKVLFITGYAENAMLANGVLEPGVEMITKPFAVEALATRIRSMLRNGQG